MADDRRGIPSGGRRDYDPPAVSLREHFEALLTGVRVAVELELAALAEKVAEGRRQAQREHEDLREDFLALQNSVNALTATEQRREGGKTVLKGGWAVFIALAGIAIGVAGLLAGILARP